MFKNKPKWLFYTVIIGVMPVILRFLTWLLLKSGQLDVFAASDLIFFGLILHISNINEIEHAVDVERNWKTGHNGTSLVFIIFYSALYVFSLLPEVFLSDRITAIAVAFSFISLYLSFIVFERLSQERSG